MNKTLLRTTIFAVASVSFAIVAQAQDGGMAGQGAMGQGGMSQGGQGGMEGQGAMGRSSMRNGSMHKRSTKMHKSGHMKRGMSGNGSM